MLEDNKYFINYLLIIFNKLSKLLKYLLLFTYKKINQFNKHYLFFAISRLISISRYFGISNSCDIIFYAVFV